MDNQSIDQIIEYQKGIHEQNQRRIKVGIRILLIIPIILLAIIFKLDSNKVVFLVIWIISLFALCAYLIAVEYGDYEIQKKLQEWGIAKEGKIQGLIPEESVMEEIVRSSGLLEKADSHISQIMMIEQRLESDTEEDKESGAWKPTSATKKETKPGATEPSKSVKSEIKSEIKHETKPAPKVYSQNTSLDDAEEELVQSIRKYVHAISEQTKQEANALDVMAQIEDVIPKTAEEYARIRKERASKNHRAIEDKKS